MKTRISTTKNVAIDSRVESWERQDGHANAGCRNGEASGLTLLEMMVAVALLLVIVTGLTMMFMQTQRAFRTGLGQVDVFESGRSAMELIARDLEQMTPSGDVSNFNFISELTYPVNSPLVPPANNKNPEVNYLRNIYALTHGSDPTYGSDWMGVSYKIVNPNAPSDHNIVVGSLYRQTTNSSRIIGNYIWQNYLDTNLFNYHRVIDGVVRFQVKVYTPEGIQVTNLISLAGSVINDTNQVQVFRDAAMPLTDQMTFFFDRDILPGYVEIELAILEPNIVELVRALPQPPLVTPAQWYASQNDFVQRNSSKIHVFRQQIPIRAAIR